MQCIAPISLVVALLALCACVSPTSNKPAVDSDYFGTTVPFASEAVYFVVTDRFVDGDSNNNFTSQGKEQFATFDRPIQLKGQGPANIGYLGGDFKGIVDNAAYIAGMGFTALWITPIIDNPDEAFRGGTPPGDGVFTDQGKTGYHGYWGVNFFKVDEHLESEDLKFADLTQTLRDGHDLKLVLDVVCNHGSPAYTMPKKQPKFGQLFDAEGMLLADHQNLHPTELDLNNPLHAFYDTTPDVAQLADMNASNPEVLDYFIAAYSQWIEQGAAAFRIDTIKHMPHEYWKSFSTRIRAQRPEFFMFAESWSYDAQKIATHTYTKNGGISVLDFPGQKAMNEVFADGASFAHLLEYLHLDDGVYQNPYELMTFYDNHDMARMNADTNGFIDANNWLFTSRGIPVVYYGSEIGFQSGAREHGGNRNYFGQENIEVARNHKIHSALTRIANIRKRSIALQRGLQVNLELGDEMAAFYRVYRRGNHAETALVLLNKSDRARSMDISRWMDDSSWQDVMTGTVVNASASVTVNAHDVQIFIANDVPSIPGLRAELEKLQKSATTIR